MGAQWEVLLINDTHHVNDCWHRSQERAFACQKDLDTGVQYILDHVERYQSMFENGIQQSAIL